MKQLFKLELTTEELETLFQCVENYYVSTMRDVNFLCNTNDNEVYTKSLEQLNDVNLIRNKLNKLKMEIE